MIHSMSMVATRLKVQLKMRSILLVKPTVMCNKDSIILNGKRHSLLTTKEYRMKEYKDVFSGMGTLPYHIQLKENKAVQ